ncbi:MAG TPA: prolyl oligopeptidase family serine peptidase [Bacteroidales bacterium]
MKYIYLFLTIMLVSCKPPQSSTPEQLLRVAYQSKCGNSERDFYLYLPKNYSSENAEKWPVMLFLHGNGERGNGKDELGFVMKQGPLYEAWIQKRDLPFIIIAPQLPMFGVDTLPGNEYILNRKISEIPARLENGVPKRPEKFGTNQPMLPAEYVDFADTMPKVYPLGWELCENDLMNMLEIVLTNYHADKNRIYLTGLSYGGFGTWYMASRHPETFAAISPVVGWGHPELMQPIAENNIPVWCFAGGRDGAVELKYFYAGMNKLEELGNTNFRFTIEEDMNHDVWIRVYGGEDIYNWFLQFSLKNEN